MSAGLEISNLNKSFGGVEVARDLNLSLPPGARKALIGPNGAGKSSLANLITGIVAPDSGTILLDGVDIGRLDEAARVKAGIGKTFQTTTLFNALTVRDNLRLPLFEKHQQARRIFPSARQAIPVEEAVEALLEQFHLSGVSETPVAQLAYGQQRLVELALTLALQPKVLILDEPGAGVARADIHLIIEAIERLPDDLAVLIIEHDMDLVFRLASSIIVMDSGAILTEGTPEAIRGDQSVRALYLGRAHG